MTKAQLETFLSACRDHDGGEPSENLLGASGEFLRCAAEDISLLRTAAASLPNLNPAGAAWLAVTLGAAIERGEGADQSASAVLDLFLSWLPRLPAPEEPKDGRAESPESSPEQAALLRAFPHLCQSVVSHLARMAERREAFAQDARLLDRLEELEDYSHGAAWVRETLLRSSGPLIVLHPLGEAGFKLRYENVANCFHLFSLIQTAIGQRAPGGRRPNEAVAAAARGRTRDATSDEAWWHYGDPRSTAAELATSIWGEASVRSIPFVNGVQVILLWPPILASRSWDSGFFGPQIEALPPNVIVEGELAAEERRAWFDRLGVESGKRRRW